MIPIQDIYVFSILIRSTNILGHHLYARHWEDSKTVGEKGGKDKPQTLKKKEITVVYFT